MFGAANIKAYLIAVVVFKWRLNGKSEDTTRASILTFVAAAEGSICHCKCARGVGEGNISLLQVCI